MSLNLDQGTGSLLLSQDTVLESQLTGSGYGYTPATTGTNIELLLQTTDAGVAAIQASTLTPLVMHHFVLGAAWGYTPTKDQLGLQGAHVLTGEVVGPVFDTGNYLKYVVTLPSDVGPLTYGEVGLFAEDNTLLAVAVASAAIEKLTGSEGGGTQVLELYVPMVGINYPAWFTYTESDNYLRISVLSSVELLPAAKDVITNTYVITGASSTQSSYLAYSDRNGMWQFDCYKFGHRVVANITDATLVSVEINIEDWHSELDPSYLGKVILQFANGHLMGTCRYVKTATLSVDETKMTLGFNAPVSVAPALGTTVELLIRDGESTVDVELPIASATELGAIKVGDTLDISLDGVLNINEDMMPVVSVNGQQGMVIINADNLPGLATVAKTGSYADLTNKPAPYALPLATTSQVGGVRIGTSGNLTIQNGILDFNGVPVRSVNGTAPDAAGNVALSTTVGLVNPTAYTGDLNTLFTTGLYTVTAGLSNCPPDAKAGTLSVTPGPDNRVVQYWSDGSTSYQRIYAVGVWSAWATALTTTSLPKATPTSLGVVAIGQGIRVVDGVISLPLGQANGVASLDANAKVPLNQLPESIVGALSYQGLWNASTNTPQLTSGVGIKGYYYKVSVAGNTVLDGTGNWNVGDLVAFSGTQWDKLTSSDSSAVRSVAGRIGDVVLTTADIQGLAPVAVSGDYVDLFNKPFIPLQTSELVNDAGFLIANQTITLSGDLTGSGVTSIPATLTNTGVQAGTYTKVTVNTKGRVIAASDLGSGDVTTALGYTPYPNTGGMISNTGCPVQINSTNNNNTHIMAYNGGVFNACWGASANYPLSVYSSSWTQLMYLDASGNLTLAGDVAGYSDEKLKTNIQPIVDPLGVVKALRGVTWDWKFKKGSSLGLIAQNVKEVCPQVVHESEDGIMSLAYGNLVGVLVEAIKALDEKIENLKGK